MAFQDNPKVSDAEMLSEEMRIKLTLEFITTVKRLEKEHNYKFSEVEINHTLLNWLKTSNKGQLRDYLKAK